MYFNYSSDVSRDTCQSQSRPVWRTGLAIVSAAAAAVSISCGAALAAPVQIEDVGGLALSGGTLQIDVTGDGVANMQFVVGNFVDPDDSTAAAVTVNYSFNNIFHTTSFTTSSTGFAYPDFPYAELYDPGAEIIGPGTGESLFDETVFLYKNDDGPLQTGASMYLGFVTTFGETENLGFPNQEFVDGTVSQFFGWLELSRGSLFFEDGFVGPADTAVVLGGSAVSEVPLPAAGWFLIAGLGGLAALRRRT